MNVVARFRSILKSEGSSTGVLQPADVAAIDAAFEEELRRPPRIAVIGETGVGKSSTINALFARGLPVSHTTACTQIETEIAVDGGHPLRIVDLPGLGEDFQSDKRHRETYARVLPEADVVLWVLKADNRAMTHVQGVLRSLVRTKVLDPKRLVVALNQVDLLQPGVWDTTINLPSVEQEETIASRRDDVVQKLRQAVRGLPDRHVVAYSALRFYNVEALLEALLSACSETRRWVLAERARCADFNALVPNDRAHKETA
jgi:small GTP-binding protein